MFRDLEKIQHTCESGFARQLRSNVGQTDRVNGFDLDLALVHTVTATDPDVQAFPDAHGAGNSSLLHTVAEAFGKDHPSDQFAAAGEAEFLDDLAHVLGVVAMDDEQGIVGVHDDKIFNTHQGNEFVGAVDVVVAGLDGQMAVGLGHVAFAVAAQAGLKLVLVERGPGAEVVPTEFGREAVEVGEVLALGGARLEDRVVDGDVFALGIERWKTSSKCGVP